MPELSPYESSLVYAHYVPNFRPNARGHHRGPATDRGGDNPQALAVDLHKGVWFDHVTGEGGDAIAFAVRVLNTDFRGACRAIEAIIGRTLIDQRSAKPSRPRFTAEDLIQSELFRAGLTWKLERELKDVKAALWSSEDDGAATRARDLTQALESALAWNAYQAAAVMKRTAPAVVRECVVEALEAQTQLARLIAALSACGAAA
jgi:hypothetical protein